MRNDGTAREETFVEGQEPTGMVWPARPHDRSGIPLAVPDRTADGALVQAVNQALEHPIANQTIPGIFARYGVSYTPLAPR